MAKSESKNGELVGVPETNLIPYDRAFEALSEFFKGGLRVTDLPRQSTPGTVNQNVDKVKWTVDNGIDEPYNEEYLEGVILAIVHGKTAFPYAYNEGPNTGACCQSWDRVTGHGNPGGDCRTCPLSQWEYKPANDEPRCGDRAWIVMQQTGKMLPTVILVPTTSCDIVKKFQLVLMAEKGLMPWQVVMRLYLRPYTTKNNQRIAQIRPRLGSYESPLDMETGATINEQVVADLRASIDAGQDTVAV